MDELSLNLRNQCIIMALLAVANAKDSHRVHFHDPQSLSKEAGM